MKKVMRWLEKHKKEIGLYIAIFDMFLILGGGMLVVGGMHNLDLTFNVNNMANGFRIFMLRNFKTDVSINLTDTGIDYKVRDITHMWIDGMRAIILGLLLTVTGSISFGMVVGWCNHEK